MRRVTKGYFREETPLFATMLVTDQTGQDEAAFTGVDVVHGGAAITVSNIDAGQGSGNITKSPTMPHDSPLLGESLETELKQTKQTYGAAFTKLIKRVKKLEQTVKASQARRRTRIVASDDEEDLVGRYEQKLDTQEGFGAGQEVTNADAELNTTSTFVSTASPQRHADTTADDLTLVETLMEIRKSAAKAKGKARMANELLRKIFILANKPRH
ncbi:hypothetical protein Tco_1445351 [Tanacetum coccineum]